MSVRILGTPVAGTVTEIVPPVIGANTLSTFAVVGAEPSISTIVGFGDGCLELGPSVTVPVINTTTITLPVGMTLPPC